MDTSLSPPAPALAPAAAQVGPGGRRPVRAPEELHPQLWRAHQLGRDVDQGLRSGFGQLDEQLPGRGWPRRALTELMLAHPGIGEMRLLAYSLAAVQRAGRLVMMFDPPAKVSAPALAELGLDVAQLLVVQTHLQVYPGADRLWALEQALKSGHVGAVVAWLPPRVRADRLRRLQLAAHAHDGPAFVFRETAAQGQTSAAPLRLALHPAGADHLALRVLKRRGPPLLAPLHLALPPVLSQSAVRRARLGQEADAVSGLNPATFINLG